MHYRRMIITLSSGYPPLLEILFRDRKRIQEGNGRENDKRKKYKKKEIEKEYKEEKGEHMEKNFLYERFNFIEKDEKLVKSRKDFFQYIFNILRYNPKYFQPEFFFARHEYLITKKKSGDEYLKIMRVLEYPLILEEYVFDDTNDDEPKLINRSLYNTGLSILKVQVVHERVIPCSKEEWEELGEEIYLESDVEPDGI